MKHSTDRILTSHAGSLIRLAEIMNYETARQRGETIDGAAYESALAEAVREVVRKQVEVGIDIVDDGEFSK